jgi:hypothetical protein
VSPCGICGGRTDNVTCFSTSTSNFSPSVLFQQCCTPSLTPHNLSTSIGPTHFGPPRKQTTSKNEMQRPSYSHITTLHSVYSAQKLNNSFQLIQLTYRNSTKSVHPIHSFSWDGAVGIAARPRDGRPRNRGFIPGSVRYFSLFPYVQPTLKPPTQRLRGVCVFVCVCV